MAGLTDIGRKSPLILVGCGKMGGALIAGWLARGAPASALIVAEPNKAALPKLPKAVRVVSDRKSLPAAVTPRAVVFAVKPQVTDSVVPDYAGFAASRALFLSIAAGKPITYFEKCLGAGARVVRAMPNTPAAVGRGMTVLVAGGTVTKADRRLASALLAAVGEVAWIEDERLMDAVTAVSGSGPAYVFHLIEALASAGEKAGLPRDLAAKLARETIIGAGELARQSDLAADVLRKNVTSPGGTTEAALKVLMGTGALVKLMARAVAAAKKRSRALAG
jgi:pyrroline-5-carboxylate reductase